MRTAVDRGRDYRLGGGDREGRKWGGGARNRGLEGVGGSSRGVGGGATVHQMIFWWHVKNGRTETRCEDAKATVRLVLNWGRYNVRQAVAYLTAGWGFAPMSEVMWSSARAPPTSATTSPSVATCSAESPRCFMGPCRSSWKCRPICSTCSSVCRCESAVTADRLRSQRTSPLA